MFFVVAKLFWAIARPLNFLFFLALAGLLAGKLGFYRARKAALALCLALFALFGFTQFPDLLLYQLEGLVAPGALPGEPAAIVVLGGGIGTLSARGGIDYHLGESADRLVKGLELHRTHPSARFIYSGGSAGLVGREPPETIGAAAMVRALYGDDRQMELENRSRSTWENAVEIARMLGENKSKPVLLVTSAFHMPRAMGCFRQAGINAIAVPADFRADVFRFPWITSETTVQFYKTSQLAKEIAGLLAYYLTGRTPTLLPH